MLRLVFLLTAAATVVVMFTDQVRWLKLAVLLWIWAALIAAMALERSAGEVRIAELRNEESGRLYRRELDREISARREYESVFAEAAREDADSRHRDQLVELRRQVDRLTDTLSGLPGHEMMQRSSVASAAGRSGEGVIEFGAQSHSQ